MKPILNLSDVSNRVIVQSGRELPVLRQCAKTPFRRKNSYQKIQTEKVRPTETDKCNVQLKRGLFGSEIITYLIKRNMITVNETKSPIMSDLLRKIMDVFNEGVFSTLEQDRQFSTTVQQNSR
jgi:hypothetical protein